MYAASWPYGRLSERLTGFGSGPRASARYATLTLALLAHGRKAELPQLLQKARAEGETPELDLAERVYESLSGRCPQPDLDIDEDPPPELGETRARKLLAQAWTSMQAAVAERRYAAALQQLDTLPSRLRTTAGPGYRLFEGYVRYAAGDADGAIDVFEELLRKQEDFAREHLALYYYLARAHDAEQHFDKAVRNMRAYVEASRGAAPAAPKR